MVPQRMEETDCGYAHRAALVAQWIEHAPPKRGMQVRFLPGARSPPRPAGDFTLQKRLAGRIRSADLPTSRQARATVSASSCPRARSKPRSSRPGGREPRGPPPRDLDAAAVHAQPPWWGVAARAGRVLGRARLLGRHAAGLRPLRLAALGPPDAARLAGHQRGAVVEAAVLHLHRPYALAGHPRSCGCG